MTNTCSARAGDLGERAAAAGVELGEDVVEDEDGLDVVVAQQPVGRQPERERERPRLAVARVALGGPVAEAQLEVVAVRADEAHAALHLLAAHPRQRLQQRGLQRRPASVSTEQR